MEKRKRFAIKVVVVVLLLIVTFLMGRTDSVSPACQYVMASLRITIYIGLLSTWAISLQRRIVQKKIRHYLLHSVGCMLLWMILRCIKYYVVLEPTVGNYLWYAYYIPQIMIGYFALLTTDCIGKSENYETPTGLYILIIPSLLAGLLVMTNEFHHFVFSGGTKNGTVDYLVGYWMVCAWILFLLGFAVIKIPRFRYAGKNRKRIFFPVNVIAMALLYCILYVLPGTAGIFGKLEYTITMCFFVVAFWEVLIQLGYIQANSDYRWCFENSSVRCQIVDKTGRAVYRSPESRPLGEDDWYILSEQGIFKPNRNTEMLIEPIRGGYVIWERNITDINNTLDKLLETQNSIKNATESLKELIVLEEKRFKVREQNRLYDLVSSQIGPKLEVLDMCVKFAKNAEGDDLFNLLKRIDIIGVYVKRRSNLILLSEKTDTDFFSELKLCYKETFDNLERCGVKTSSLYRGEFSIGCKEAFLVYDFLEALLEETLDSLTEVSVIVTVNGSKITVTVGMLCPKLANQGLCLDKIRGRLENNPRADFEAEDGYITGVLSVEGREMPKC